MRLLATCPFSIAGRFLETLSNQGRAAPDCPSGHFWSCLPATKQAFIWLGQPASLWQQGPRKIKCHSSVISQFLWEIQFLFLFELQGACLLSSQQPEQRPLGLILSEPAPCALMHCFPFWAQTQSWSWVFPNTEMAPSHRCTAVGSPPTLLPPLLVLQNWVIRTLQLTSTHVGYLSNRR